MNWLIRLYELGKSALSLIGSITGATFIALMTLLITVDVLGRALGQPTYVATEMSGYMLVGITFLGLAYTQRKGGHIKITMVTNLLPNRLQKQLEIATLLVSIIFIGWCAWATVTPVIESYIYNRTSLTVIHTPLWIVQLVIPVGFAMLALELLFKFITTIGSRRTAKEQEIRQKGNSNA